MQLPISRKEEVGFPNYLSQGWAPYRGMMVHGKVTSQVLRPGSAPLFPHQLCSFGCIPDFLFYIIYK